jgi:hypothetical protein
MTKLGNPAARAKHTMCLCACVSLCLAMLQIGSTAGGGEVKFTAKPTAAKAGDKVKIEFAVDRETDVAVFVENGGGKIVRHLVAGVLGNNPPAPLKAGLAQSVEWDGLADYGKPAGAGPFKVRVALGLGAKFDKVLFSDPNTMSGVSGLATGPDGKVYVLHGVGGAVWGNLTLRGFNRDGTYSHTVMPFPSNLKLEQAKAFGAFELNGRATPLMQSERLALYQFIGGPRKHKMTVTPDGVILNLCGNRLLAVDTGGAPAWGSHEGPPLPGSARDRAFVTSATDGKSAFVGGLDKVQTAVYRVKLPERASAAVFFGEPGKAGNDETHLGAAGAGGAAVDGKGNVLLTDPSNGRVVVVGEGDGKFVGSFPVANGDGSAVDPATGAVYLLLTGKGDRADLVKFSGWKDAKEVARLPITNIGNPGYPPNIALDASAKPPVVWVGTDYGRLIRVEDAGAKLEAKDVGNDKMGTAAFLDVTVDRFRPDREIYTRCGTSQNWWWRFNEESGKVEQIRNGIGSGGGTGTNLVAGPDGSLYSLQWPMRFMKFDRSGKPSPWEQPDTRAFKSDGFDGRYPPHCSYAPVSETEMPHCMGVRADGHIFVMEPANPGNRPPKAIYEYLPSGKRASDDPVVWKVSDGAVGPRFDAAGNIYVADIVKPMNWVYPPEFDKVFPAKVEINKTRPGGAQNNVANMYGSIVKFSPKGGIIDYKMSSDAGGSVVAPLPYKGTPKLDPGLKSMDVSWYACTMWRGPEKLVGAEWIHPGVSHIGVFSCTCENITFDVDEFGRVFFPDVNLFQVRVIDTAGNALAKFGGYGNAESCGSESKDKALATPEIAFAWVVGVGATDKYIYTGDSINRRMLRSKIVYAAEESCEVR